MAFHPRNNFSLLKRDFKDETDKNADSNKEYYIAYFNARMADNTAQCLEELAYQMELLNKQVEALTKTVAQSSQVKSTR